MKYKTPVLSGTPVSGKSSLSRLISERYSIPIVSTGTILREQHKGLYPNGDVSFEDWYGTLSGETTQQLNWQARDIFELGGVVGESRFVAHLDPQKVIRIFVDAPLDVRATRAVSDMGRPEYFGRPVVEVIDILMKREADEARIGNELFGIDYRDPGQYDLLISTHTMTLIEELNLVVAELGSNVMRD